MTIMLQYILKSLDVLGVIPHAHAHCDIPCGIYDPMPALIASLSVIRIMDIMEEATQKPDSIGKTNLLARNALRKEEEAEKVKHEVRIIWGDYFKGPLLEKYPNIHDLAHSIMLKGSACKQDVHRKDAEELLELVNKFAEIFWDTKGKQTKRIIAPYQPNLEIVQPVL